MWLVSYQCRQQPFTPFSKISEREGAFALAGARFANRK
jgi:hypothetical protein